MTRIVFLGTPHPAIPTLLALDEVFDVVGVITRPDKPKGRSRHPQPPPVKSAAESLEIPVYQPVRRDETAEILEALGAVDLGVVVAFGQILTDRALGLPKDGMLNVHFSLLPRWRGAAPVARAILAGDTMSGVSIIQIAPELDSGPVVTAQAVDIGPEETAGELTSRLSLLGARLLTESVVPYLEGTLPPIPQVEDGLTYAEKLTAADRPLSPGDEVEPFVNRVRALSPAPGATLQIDDERFKILRARSSEEDLDPGLWAEVNSRVLVGVRDGAVEIVELQPPGRKAMAGADWLRGHRTSRGRVG